MNGRDQGFHQLQEKADCMGLASPDRIALAEFWTDEWGVMLFVYTDNSEDCDIELLNAKGDHLSVVGGSWFGSFPGYLSLIDSGSVWVAPLTGISEVAGGQLVEMRGGIVGPGVDCVIANSKTGKQVKLPINPVTRAFVFGHDPKHRYKFCSAPSD